MVVDWFLVVAWVLAEWLLVVVWLGGCPWLPGEVVSSSKVHSDSLLACWAVGLCCCLDCIRVEEVCR